MKHFKTTVMALLAATAAASSFAQSSVTLYGRLNTSIENQKTNNGLRVWAVNSNDSLLGFKGVEDIGGGLKASFKLEHVLNADNGSAPNPFWGRESWVQLAGSFGSVRLGNFTPESYFATAEYLSLHNHDSGTSSDRLYDRSAHRSSNKLGYYTPEMGGFVFHAAVSAGEGQGTNKRIYDLAANYDAGPLHLGFGMSDHGSADQWTARALYELGAFTVGAYYQAAERPGLKYKAARLVGMYVSGASEFHVNFGKATNGDQWTLGYNYKLSKRTKIYGYYTDLDTSKSVRNTGELSSLALGVRHSF